MKYETKPSSSHMIGALWRGSVHFIAYFTLTQTFCNWESTTIIFHIPKKPYVWMRLQHPSPPPLKKKDYSSIANCRIKIPTIFPGIFEMFRCIYIFLYLLHDFSRNPYRLSVETWWWNTGLHFTREYVHRKHNTFIHSVSMKQPSRFPREL